MFEFIDNQLLVIILSLITAGAFSGLIAGIFGVGGGILTVPVLYELFRFYGIPDSILMPICTATSLAIIAPTSLASFLGHLKHGLVEMRFLKIWVAPIFLGVFLGSLLASRVPADFFKIIYICITAFASFHLLYLKDRMATKSTEPSTLLSAAIGFIVGISSMLMGVGGGLLSSLYLIYYGRTVHQAISTSSGVGMLIAIPGSIGYIIAGWSLPETYPTVELIQHPLALGYISLAGFVCMVPTSILAAPLGARLAHSLPKNVLEKLFGSFLLIICLRFLYSLKIFH